METQLPNENNDKQNNSEEEIIESPKSLGDPFQHSEKMKMAVIRTQYIYSIVGLITSLVCIIGGILLCLSGIYEDTDFKLHLPGGIKTEVNQAAPGVVLFIVGVLVSWITKFKIPFLMGSTDSKST